MASVMALRTEMGVKIRSCDRKDEERQYRPDKEKEPRDSEESWGSMQRMRDSIYIFFPVGKENKCVAAVETGGKQMSTGHLHLDGFESQS